MRGSEHCYTVIEQGCLAVIEAVEHFSVYLLGARLAICTDHSSLKYLNRMKDGNGRLNQWSTWHSYGRLNQWSMALLREAQPVVHGTPTGGSTSGPWHSNCICTTLSTVPGLTTRMLMGCLASLSLRHSPALRQRKALRSLSSENQREMSQGDIETLKKIMIFIENH